ncbi:hypothetical protein A8W25_10065 [Streptomyces sp. ERV7]|uniref:hypothetical protein n=1 Tax=Streptomyces sp. ERV7 TaxID=1322334 RepID=UPI0007F469C1|nr:hypothetical protein [Streptomyces sp. ERV7]OAR25865.1 hypothetical protein A8W25_10065 [Streptomyces sp. ERV7]
MYVESEHISNWLDEGRATQLAVASSRAFDEYLCTLAWGPSRLDWRSIPFSSFNYEQNGWSGQSAVDWARTNRFLESTHAFVMYSASEPGILCSAADAFYELDYLTMGRVHPAYICAAAQGEDGPVLSFERFAEWDGFSVLMTPLS